MNRPNVGVDGRSVQFQFHIFAGIWIGDSDSGIVTLLLPYRYPIVKESRICDSEKKIRSYPIAGSKMTSNRLL